MTKHSKNATDGAVFTYNERKGMHHGSKRMRIPGAGLRPWDHCALSLSPAERMVITKQGYVYDREAILRTLLAQRVCIKQAENSNRRAGEAQHAALRRSRKQKELKDATAFEQREERIHRRVDGNSYGASVEKKDEVHSEETSFWMPGTAASVESEKGHAVDKVQKPQRRPRTMRTTCPATGAPLRPKDLITLRPTPISSASVRGDEADPASTSTGRYMCPVCFGALTNASRPTALRTGTVLCAACVTSFVINERRDPVTTDPINSETDIIVIRNGGTAYAASGGESKEGTVYRPSAR